MTSNEEYKKFIKDMIDCIDNNRDLEQIFIITHGKFLKEGVENDKN